MSILEGDTIKLHPKTGKGKQVIHRDGSLFKVRYITKLQGKDWINLNSIDNPKNGSWIRYFHDKNFDWEIIR